MSEYVKARTSDRAQNGTRNGDLPLVWVLQGHRAGDNLQVQALADGLGWPWQAKSLTWQENWLKRLPRWTPFYGRSASLKTLTSQAQEAFAPPWPDIVLSVGWRSVPVARWIKAQSGARLVHLGRPRAPLDCFDLVFTTPQYRLPLAKNVVHLTGPLTTLPPNAGSEDANAWEARLAHLPRPWIAVLVGGDTPTLKFPLSAAAALATSANDHAASCKGSLLVLTSPRTSKQVTEVLQEAIQAPTFFQSYSRDDENPYAAFLALADRFIVTNDSVSMTHEAALTGRPLQIFRLTAQESMAKQAHLGWDRKMRAADTVIGKTYLGLIRQGVIYPPKSPADYFDQLIENGHATYSGCPRDAVSDASAIEPGNERAVKAVKAFFYPAGKAASGSS
ncbi:mitochondrial fission ELM1 family protein [bacterium]|nr:mitochondrial fission ELM1 family protein [bacterium]